MESSQANTITQTEHVIEIKDNDEIATIREQMQWTQSPRVILIVPKKNKAMREKVNLRLVQRVAMDQSLELGLVARHRDTVRLARELGIPVFSSVRSGARRGRWNGVLPRFVDEGDAVKIVAPRLSRVSRPYQMLGLAILAVLIGVLSAGLVFMAPNATITLAPLKENVAISVEVLANPALKINSGSQIPARVEEIPVQGSVAMAPIAKRDVNDKAANGIVQFTNNTEQPLTVPKDTIVVTSAGEPIRFKTHSPLELGPRARGEISVTALVAGPTGNAPQFAINRVEGGLIAAVNVVNPRALSGGTVKKSPYVTAEDKKRLEEQLTRQLRQEAVSLFREKQREQDFIVPESIQVTLETETFDKALDEPTDLLTLTAQGAAKGTIINGANANLVALNELNAKKRANFMLVDETVTYTPGAILSADPDKGSVRFQMRASAQSLFVIERQFVANAVRGLSVAQAEEWIAQRVSLRRPPLVELKSDWFGLKKLPYFAFRIDVVSVGD